MAAPGVEITDCRKKRKMEVPDTFLNGSLPYCEICELLDQLTSGPVILDVSDNLEDFCWPFPANCP